MRIRVQVVIEGDDDIPPEVHEVAELYRDDLGADTLGLQLAEAKELLARMQEVVVEEQVRACLAAKVACPHCGQARRHKDERSIAVAQPVRHAAPPQSSLAPLPLPAPGETDLQPADRGPAGADDP
jgi:hypothetical protein